jgi:hypothetical protein
VFEDNEVMSVALMVSEEYVLAPAAVIVLPVD